MMADFDLHSVCARCRDKKKGSDPCIETPPAACSHCDALSSEQKAQLSTPSYKLKKEKKEAKSSTPAKALDTLSPTLVDPALVSVVGVVDGQTTSGLSGPAEKKSKKAESKKSSTSAKLARSDKLVKSSSNRPPTTSTTDQGKSTTSSTDSKISVLDRKWSDRFNRLEALLMAKILDKPQDPVFSTVKVTPAHAPPANVVRPDPFLKPASQPSQPTDPAIDSPATDSSQHKPAARASSSAQPEPSTRETAERRLTSAFDTSSKESPSSSESDTDSLSSYRPPLDLFPEEGELSDDQEANLSDHDQSLSEEQSYRETMRGIRSYMSWNHIPDIDSGATTSEDNPFAGPKLHTPGKVSVNLPTNEWLCRKMSKLNITLVQGYPMHTSEAGGLLRDQFVRPPKSQQKWYGFHPNPKKDFDQSVPSWHTGSSKLNSTYLRIARQAGIATSPPMSRPISQENLRKWERSARESIVICNHAAGFNRCLAKSMEHLTEFIFVTMANTTLLRRGAPLHLDTLFLDNIVKRAEDDITSFDKGRSASVYKGRRYHPYERQDSRSEKYQDRPAWKNLSRTQHRKNNKGKQQYSSRPAKGQQQYK